MRRLARRIAATCASTARSESIRRRRAPRVLEALLRDQARHALPQGRVDDRLAPPPARPPGHAQNGHSECVIAPRHGARHRPAAPRRQRPSSTGTRGRHVRRPYASRSPSAASVAAGGRGTARRTPRRRRAPPRARRARARARRVPAAGRRPCRAARRGRSRAAASGGSDRARQSAASSSDPVGAASIFASAASAPSMRGGCRRGPKYERTRVRRSPPCRRRAPGRGGRASRSTPGPAGMPAARWRCCRAPRGASQRSTITSSAVSAPRSWASPISAHAAPRPSRARRAARDGMAAR